MNGIRKLGKGRSTKKTAAVYLLMLPGLAYFLLNNYLPMFGVVMAFKRIDFRQGILKSPWVGLENFKFLFSSGNAWVITRNTVLYNIVFILLGIVLGVSIAILLNEIRGKFTQRFYQTAILVPYLLSWVVVGYLGFAFLSTENGFINNTILPFFGVDPVAFYRSPQYWPFIIVVVNLWKGIGISMIIYYSTVVGISPEYYEAAKVDGATKWKQITHITLPFLKSTIITLFILNVSKMFYSDFGLFYQLPKNSGLLYSTTQTIDVYVYNALMNQNNFAMSSAAGLYQSAVGFALVLSANLLIRRISKEDALF